MAEHLSALELQMREAVYRSFPFRKARLYALLNYHRSNYKAMEATLALELGLSPTQREKAGVVIRQFM